MSDGVLLDLNDVSPSEKLSADLLFSLSSLSIALVAKLLFWRITLLVLLVLLVLLALLLLLLLLLL